jgi:hypothetical protein
MFENRIRDFYTAPVFAPAFAGFEPAFVACPVPVFTTFTATQQAFVAEVYRRAQEMTAAQFRQPPRRTIPEFSLN